MDYEALTFWLALFQFLVTGGLAVWVGVIARTRYNAKRIREHEDAVDARLDNVERLLARLEERTKQAPDSASIGKLHARLDALGATTATLTGAVGAWKESLAMIHEHLLQNR